MGLILSFKTTFFKTEMPEEGTYYAIKAKITNLSCDQMQYWCEKTCVFFTLMDESSFLGVLELELLIYFFKNLLEFL